MIPAMAMYARSVGNFDTARGCCGEVDMFCPRTEIGDQAQPFSCACDHFCINAVGHGGHQHVAIGHRGDKRFSAHRHVIGVKHRIIQFAHPRLNVGHQMACDDNFGLACGELRRGLCLGHAHALMALGLAGQAAVVRIGDAIE